MSSSSSQSISSSSSSTAPGTDYFWSTKAYTFAAQAYTFKIIPESFDGIELQAAKSESGIQAPNTLIFHISNKDNVLDKSDFKAARVLVKLVMNDGTNEEIIRQWKFKTIRCESVYQRLEFTCEDFLAPHLRTTAPNSKLVSEISPSTDADIIDDVCVPLFFGEAYIPLRSIYITDKRYYVLGPTNRTYTIDKVRSPRGMGTKIEWSAPAYKFDQATKIINGVSWRVMEAIIADSDLDGVADANGLFLIGESFVDMPTKLTASDTASLTDPADVTEFVLESLGVCSVDIDTGGGSTFAGCSTTYSGWGLAWSGGYSRHMPAQKMIAQLLNMCHATLDITDKVEMRVLSKTSQKTITKADVINRRYPGEGTFRAMSLREWESDSGYVAFQEADESQETLVKVLVPAKNKTEHISGEILELPLVRNARHSQKLGRLYFQQKFFPKNASGFMGKPTLLALQPKDVITINHADYGGTYNVLVDSMHIHRDVSISFVVVEPKEPLQDWEDISVGPVLVVGDDTTGAWRMGYTQTPGQTFKLNSDGSGSIGGASQISWTKEGLISIPGGLVTTGINAGNITVGTLAAAIIGAATVTADKLDVASLAAITAIFGNLKTAAAGARIEILPDANTGLIAYDNAANEIFKILVGGADVGDVIIGNYPTKGVKWDKSAANFLVGGDIIATGNIKSGALTDHAVDTDAAFTLATSSTSNSGGQVTVTTVAASDIAIVNASAGGSTGAATKMSIWRSTGGNYSKLTYSVVNINPNTGDGASITYMDAPGVAGNISYRIGGTKTGVRVATLRVMQISATVLKRT